MSYRYGWVRCYRQRLDSDADSGSLCSPERRRNEQEIHDSVQQSSYDCEVCTAENEHGFSLIGIKSDLKKLQGQYNDALQQRRDNELRLHEFDSALHYYDQKQLLGQDCSAQIEGTLVNQGAAGMEKLRLEWKLSELRRDIETHSQQCQSLQPWLNRREQGVQNQETQIMNYNLRFHNFRKLY